MTKKTLHQTTFDYAVIAVSPALIMTLVGSLIFFLIEVFYRGSYTGRLHYIFALFVFAITLIARISIEEGRERAAGFALPLAVVMLLATGKFVKFQGEFAGQFSFFINVGLLGFIWWATDKLTWDCTQIDDEEEDSGEGLLGAVGLDRSGKLDLEKEITPHAESLDGTTSRNDPKLGWFERRKERRRRPHAHGVWVVYFSLAAVALFGLGQLCIPKDDAPGRQYVFILLCVYTASGLGLLMTTSFLGLRRYLRQRRQEMPATTANLWLSIGVILIAGVMTAAMLVPRTNPEYAISELPIQVGSPDQNASRYGMGDAKDGQAEKDSRQGQSRSSSRQQNDSGEKTTEKAPNSDNERSKEKDARQSPGSQKNQTAGQKKNGDEQRSNADATKNRPSSEAHEKRQKDSQSGGRTQPPSSMRQFHPEIPKLSNPFSLDFVKWIFYAALAVVAAVAVWKHRDELLAFFRDFWRQLLDFWNALFDGKRKQVDGAENEATAKKPRPFSEFSNPFASSMAGTMSPEELTRYSFEALEAWGQENGCPRDAEQTPNEFARRLGTQFTALADDADRLADMYCQVAYSPGTLKTANADCLADLWRNMTSPIPAATQA